MKPFDLPPDNAPDALRADLCRPAEMREHESYLSKPVDDDGHDHEDAPPTQPLPFPPELTVPSVRQQMDQYRRRPQVWLYPGMPLPLSAAVVEDGEPPPPGSRIISVLQRPQQ